MSDDNPYDCPDDDDELLEEWHQADLDAAATLREMLGPMVDQAPPEADLADAVAALRAGVAAGAWPFDWFAAANGWSGGIPPEWTDEESWIEAAASVVSPFGDPGWPAEDQAVLDALSHADWLGAVVGAVRRGAGADMAAASLVRYADELPEIEGEHEADSREFVEHAWEIATPLWQALGAIDEDRRLTRLGWWGLPQALLESWDDDEDEQLPAEIAAAVQSTVILAEEFEAWRADPGDYAQVRLDAVVTLISAEGLAPMVAMNVQPEWAPFLSFVVDGAGKTLAAAAPAWLLATLAERAGDTGEEQRWLDLALDRDPAHRESLWRAAENAGDRGDAVAAAELLHRSNPAVDDEELATYARFARRPTSSAVSRNAPCPCGSGRKHKLCCGQRIGHPLPERAHWLFAKLGRFLQRPPQRGILLEYAAVRTGAEPHIIETTWAAMSDPVVADCAAFEGGLFDRFLAVRGPLLPADERELAQTWRETSRGLYEVVGTRPGMAIRLRDLASDREYDVRERTASRTLKPREMLLTRLLGTGDGLMLGVPLTVPRSQRPQLAAALADGSTEALLGWLRAAEQGPRLQNTEGHDLVMVSQRWQLSAPEAFDRLGAERLDEDDADERTLLRADRTVVGSFRRDGTDVELSTNSHERAAELEALLLAADPDAELLDERSETVEQSRRRPHVVPDPVELTPEILAAMRERLMTFEREWVDSEIPALGDLTPREALKSPWSKRELEALLADMDVMAAQNPGMTMDPDRIRDLLGLRD
ncbi:hypothetical protein BH20ACT5_BH20ACT5_12560 [soil metagenome]